MGVSSGLRAAAKNAPDAVKSALRRARTAFSNIKYVPSRVGTGAQNSAAALIKSDPTAMAKSVDDAAATTKALDDINSHPLGDAKTSTKGEPPPAKDPTTDMPAGPTRTAKRWDQVKTAVGSTTVLAGVGVATFLAVSGVFLQNTDGVEVKITKIEKIKDEQKKYKFTYATQGGQKCGSPPIACIQNAFNPCKSDTFTFRSTHTTPTMDDVTAVVVDVDDKAVYFELDLTSIGDGKPEWGFMTCHSSFSNQFRGSIRDTVQLIADVAADVALPIVNGFCDAIPIPFICPDSFNFSNWTVWVCIICIILTCLGITVAAFS